MPDTPDPAVRAERIDRLQRYIPMLSKEDQDLFWLRYELGKFEQDIAVILGFTHQNVNWRLNRLKARLAVRVKLELVTEEVRARLKPLSLYTQVQHLWLNERTKNRLIHFWATGSGSETARRCGVATSEGMNRVRLSVGRLKVLDSDLYRRFQLLLENSKAVSSMEQCKRRRGRR